MTSFIKRFGSALVDNGQLHLNKKIYAQDERPIDDQCSCYTCKTYTRAFLHTAFYAEEVTACSLLSYHNVAFQVKYVNNIAFGSLFIVLSKRFALFDVIDAPDAKN